MAQLKSPLPLLVSDLRDRDPEDDAEATVNRLAARVGQLWNLFTGLEGKVNQVVRDLAGSTVNSPSDNQGSGPKIDGTAQGPQGGMQNLGLPRSSPSAPSCSSAGSSRHVRRQHMPTLGKVRIVFDALHPRAEMQEVTITFPELRERPGLYDWVHPKDLVRLQSWVQEAANDHACAHFRGEPEATMKETKDIRFCLPGAGTSTCAEAS
eukprot:CAMPEP_0175453096 /NCGR_PEP_ID=MMETSP0095-20121207/63763_1 /TAXON_ID=311494 /ORGANISM="Alexandrium monilatum, Strain CCMP3105" /LENGTH=207 /DNA_ID=CAMNT_0016753697 /DNA_START=10 /DNA_END=630 /DNA_ORIENTATION=+